MLSVSLTVNGKCYIPTRRPRGRPRKPKPLVPDPPKPRRARGRPRKCVPDLCNSSSPRERPRKYAAPVAERILDILSRTEEPQKSEIPDTARILDGTSGVHDGPIPDVKFPFLILSTEYGVQYKINDVRNLGDPLTATTMQRKSARKRGLNGPAKKKFSCPHCNYKNSKRTSLEQHLTYHVRGVSFVCEACGKTFICERSLNIHMNQARHSCLHCGTVMRNPSEQEYHRRLHSVGVINEP